MGVKQFTDAAGRVWTITTDMAAARRLRRAGHDIVEYESASGQVPLLYTDELAMAEALYAILLPQAEAHSPAVSEDEFLAAMTGEVAGAAREALIAALPDFFFGPKKEIMSQLIAGLAAEMSRQVDQVIQSFASHGETSTNG